MEKVKKKNAIWIHGMSGSMGIVSYDNGHEKKIYIGPIENFSEEEDIEAVSTRGAKLTKEVLKELLEFLES